MAGGVTELEESAETVGGDFEGVDEDGSNISGLWDDVQGSGTYSAAVWQKKLGDNRGNVEYPRGVSPIVN